MIIRKIPRRQSKLATQSVPRFDLNSTSAFGWADGEVDRERERGWQQSCIPACLSGWYGTDRQKDDGHINSLPPKSYACCAKSVCVCVGRNLFYGGQWICILGFLPSLYYYSCTCSSVVCPCTLYQSCRRVRCV